LPVEFDYSDLSSQSLLVLSLQQRQFCPVLYGIGDNLSTERALSRPGKNNPTFSGASPGSNLHQSILKSQSRKKINHCLFVQLSVRVTRPTSH
jgi:hypothetical protein